MKVLKMGRIILMGVFLMSAASFAQQAAPPDSQQQGGSKPMQPRQGMAMDQMMMDQKMQSCHADMDSILKSSAELKKTIEQAKTSGDRAKMRSALDAASKYADALNVHMNTCMTAMQNMSGAGMNCGDMQHMGQGSMMREGK